MVNAEVTGDLGGGFAGGVELVGVADLAVGEWSAAAEVCRRHLET